MSAADPLNLVGIITPGGRITAHTSNRILYRNGEPVAVLESGEIPFPRRAEPYDGMESEERAIA